jgi:hypothetical protein
MAAGVMECRSGLRQCDDDASDGSFGFTDACKVNDSDTVVPPEFCSAYAGCDQSNPTDPLACANQQVASGKISCRQFYTPTGGLCPERNFNLPAPPMGSGCIWTIAGGTDQAHWKVGVGANGMSPSGMVASCAAFFTVLQNLDLIPQADQFFLAFTDDQQMTPVGVQIDLSPMLVPTCPANTGLQCTVTQAPF